MTDFRVKTGFFGHFKTEKLQRKLGVDAVMSLLRLWAFAADTRQDGDLAGMDADDIAMVAKWPGDSAAFVDALASIGWIDGESGAYVLHDWEEEQPFVAAAPERSDDAKVKAAIRWHKAGKHAAKPRDNCPLCQSMPTAMPPALHPASTLHADGNAPTPTPDPTPNPVPIPTPASAVADGLLTKPQFVELLADGVTTQPTKDAYDAFREVCPTRKELTAAIAELRAKGWDGVFDRGAYVVGAVKRRREAAQRAPPDPTNGGRVGYHRGSTDFEVGTHVFR